MNRFDPKAIIIAMLLSLALDVVGGVALVAGFGVQVTAQMTPEETQAAIEAVTATDGFMFASLLYGTATTVFGGFVAARVARSHPYFNALAVGLVGLVLGLVMGGEAPFWFEALAFLVSVPAALAGGHLALRRPTR
ncbi:hypothetical protein [Piscinibacter gummiphilus]|uniref:DUF1275 domain-containing protein n=1 Tax=Piscinibacter gummiphilus TaxID=946333 RepID=A0ABZ0CVM5_9BURK|nr:hypothetical protein [Piscinibacter gummiphilus]WOB09024.1 hypothetical protein RXV79_02965 [Piscinibacter gummiphilus]